MRVPYLILSVVLLSSSWLTAADLRQIGMVNIPGPPGFADLGFADGMLVMTHPAAAAIDIFDPVRRRVIAQIVGLQSPRGLAVDDAGGRVYVADHGSNSVIVISTDGWKVVDTIKLAGSPSRILLDGNGNLYWSDDAAGSISLLDLKTKQDVAKLQTGGTPRELVFDSARHVLFATLQDVHQVIALDPQLKVVSRFNLNASQPTGMVYDPQQHELYVAVRHAVLAINADNGSEMARVPAPAGVDMLWLDSSSQVLYAASEGSLILIQAKGTLRAVDEIATQVKGHTVAYDTDKQMVLVPGGREGKSKLVLLRPMTPTPQAGAAQAAQ